MKSKNVAIIHDWLSVNGGAEIVLKHLLKMFPEADLYTMIDTLPTDKREWLAGHNIYTSCLQKIPWVRKHYRYFIPMMPYLVEQFDLSSYDLVISSSHAVAKGVIVHPDQRHIAYIYSPMRYAWDLMYEHARLGVFGKGPLNLIMKCWLHKMRLWDFVSAQRPDVLLADSYFIQRRIKKSWGRDAKVVYPPVEFDACVFEEKKEEYYVTLSRLVQYKRVDLIVEAFNHMPDKRLIVIGDGPSLKNLQKMAKENITVMGYLPREEAMRYVQKAKAFLFMAKEDFGIAPLEASASGTPVIAYGKGGASETVVDGVTGVYVEEQTSEALINAIEYFETFTINPQKCKEHASLFSVENFNKNFASYVEERIEK